MRNVLLALLASLAKLEAQKISARVRAGMNRAKANGTHVGRPKLDLENPAQPGRWFNRASKAAMIAFVHRFWIHYDIYRRCPLPWFPALRNAWRIARPGF